MGYYTEYNLTLQKVDIDKETGHVEKLNEEISPDILEEIDRMLTEESPLEGDGDGEWNCEDRWYSPDPELLLGKVSEAYPDILFTLTGFGENHYDIWIEYFLNGQFQMGEGKITFERFSPKKLSSPQKWADDKYSDYDWYQEAYM